jgi:predicted dehydrogenase
VKIAVIGAAGHYQVALDGSREDKDAVICAAAPGCPEEDAATLGEACRKENPRCSFYEDWQEMIRQEKPDITVVNSWYGQNDRIAEFCLEQGSAVYAEKPFSNTMEGLNQLKACREKSGVPLGIMLTCRYEPWFLTMDDAVKRGLIGKIRLIHAQKSYKLGTRPDFFRQRDMFTGLFPWVGIHAVDWILHFGGTPKEIMAWHSADENRGMGEMEISAAGILRMENNIFATLSADYLRPAGAATHEDDRLRLTGTAGVLETVNGRVYLEDEKEAKREIPLLPGLNPFAEFLKSVREGKTQELAEAGFEATRAALLLRDAADADHLIRTV